MWLFEENTILTTVIVVKVQDCEKRWEALLQILKGNISKGFCMLY